MPCAACFRWGGANLSVRLLAKSPGRSAVLIFLLAFLGARSAVQAQPVLLSATTLLTESCLPANGAVDPYETVTVNWAITNSGTAPTTNLVATLLTTNGIYYPSGAQDYGAIPPGGSAVRPFSFIPAGRCGDWVTGVVQLVDGGANLGFQTNLFLLGSPVITTQVFANASFINILDDSPADPYPSSINVAGVTGTLLDVTVTLAGFGHSFPQDVDALLVRDTGPTVMLMANCGADFPVDGLTLRFNDDATNQLPLTASLMDATYQPNNYAFSDVLPTPAPAGPYGEMLTPLAAEPNGTWSLYVWDNSPQDAGQITNGWSLTLVTSNVVCCTTFPAPTLARAGWSNNVVRLDWNAIPGPHYQVQYRTNLVAGAWQSLGAPVLATNTVMGAIDSSPNSRMRFYRVVVSE